MKSAITRRSRNMSGDPTPHCEFDAQDLIFRLETTIPADVSKISPVVEQVMELAQEMDCTTGKEFEIETDSPWMQTGPEPEDTAMRRMRSIEGNAHYCA
jgi:hypothetical protein